MWPCGISAGCAARSKGYKAKARRSPFASAFCNPLNCIPFRAAYRMHVGSMRRAERVVDSASGSGRRNRLAPRIGAFLIVISL